MSLDSTPADKHRVIAFDFGTKFIGACYGQRYLGQWRILKSIKAKDGIPQWHEIQSLIEENKPDKLLIGLPLHMDGSDNESCRKARKFANRLHAKFNIAIEMIDERLTSDEAEGVNAPGDIHGRSAFLIFQSWLAAQD